VTDWLCCGVVGYPNALLCFDLNLSSQNLWTPTYSNHQQFLYDTITNLREKEMNDVQIANWLNENGHKTPRGNTFRNNHVHSIVKDGLEITNTVIPLVDIAINDTSRLTAVIFLIIFLLPLNGFLLVKLYYNFNIHFRSLDQA
jgi:hypothetical protein